MQLFRTLFKNILTFNNQIMRPANLKTFNVKEIKSEHLFDEMINKPGLLFLKKVFTEKGYGLKIAGGAVRDLICGKVPDDIDLATTATPDKMISMLENSEDAENRVRLITTKAGEKHGTIITRINDQAQYEITTLRIDKITDGRHADVEFIEDWKLDAARRDLTFNSLFLDFDGTIYDYFNGVEHLKEKKVLFVGDPIERMEEDYLRILRYFRFYIRYGNLVDHDQSVIDAIEKCKDGLESISGPRIWTELKKILSYKNSVKVIDVIFNQLKLGIYMGFNSNPKSVARAIEISNNLDEFNNLVDSDIKLRNELKDDSVLNGQTNNLSEKDKQSNYLCIFCSLVDDENELLDLRKRLSLSNLELWTGSSILHYRDKNNKIILDLNKATKELVMTANSEKERKKATLLEVFKYKGDLESYLDFRKKPLPVFPNLANKIKDRFQDKSLVGGYLNKLKEIWMESDYKLNEDQLLEKFEELFKSDYKPNYNLKRLKK